MGGPGMMPGNENAGMQAMMNSYGGMMGGSQAPVVKKGTDIRGKDMAKERRDQLKKEASAAKGYTTEGVFNISASELKNSGQPVVEGAKTGLSANSIVLNTAIANQTYFIAVWQKKMFMVILAVLNIDATAAKKVASSENDRIK